ncbi:MAG: trigger factor [Bacteroidales bacterium]|jgi:trigger factor|nr:trigger factor [Bacteroidales bacterium]MDN5350067.1 trigger factor [Bacteroidales bacterium]
MNITQEPLTDLTAKIQISLEKNDYEKEVNESLKSYQRKASMPGFRPGKVPFGLVKKMYGKAVLADKVNQLVSDKLNNYIIENKLPVLGYPMPMNDSQFFDDDNREQFDFMFELALSPDFKLDLNGTVVPYIRIEATNEEIQQAIDNMLLSNPVITQCETIGADDRVNVALAEADEKGEEIEGGFTKEFTFHMDQIKSAEAREQLIGKEIGSEFIFNFSKALEDEEAAAKILELDEDQKNIAKADFNMIINEVIHEERAELNEDLFEKIFPGAEINDEQAFREKIKQEIEKQYESESDRYFFTKAVDQLIETFEAPLPDDFLKRWLVYNSEGKLSKEAVEAEYDTKYANSIKWQMIEAELLKNNEDLKVTEKDIRDQMKSYLFANFGMGELDEEMSKRMDGIVDSMLENNDEHSRLHNELFEKKLAAYFKTEMTLQEETMTYSDFVAKINAENNHKNEIADE